MMTERTPSSAAAVAAGVLTTPAPAVIDVSVVICGYTERRWDGLGRAVRSVLNQHPPAMEVLVVVDHDARLLARARQQWPEREPGFRPGVRVLESAGTPGLSGARNTGLAAAAAEIVAFLDDDAQAEPGCVGQLVDCHRDPWVLACGGRVTPVLERPRPPWWPPEFDWVVGCCYVGLPAERADVRNVIGANMSIRRTAAIAVGGFAENLGRVGLLPLGCEETDLCIRLRQRWPSARVVYEPAAGARHAVPAERMSWRYFRRRCFAEGTSKAMVGARVGTGAALSSERAYVRRVLPRGIARGALGACRGDRGASLRGATILAGLGLTTAGYVWGRLRPSRRAVTVAASRIDDGHQQLDAG